MRGGPALTGSPVCLWGPLARPAFPLVTRVRCRAGPRGDGRKQSTRVLDSSSAKPRPSRPGLCYSVWSADLPWRPALRVSQVPRVPLAGFASTAVRTVPKYRPLAGSSSVSGLAERGVSELSGGNPPRASRGVGEGGLCPQSELYSNFTLILVLPFLAGVNQRSWLCCCYGNGSDSASVSRARCLVSLPPAKPAFCRSELKPDAATGPPQARAVLQVR